MVMIHYRKGLYIQTEAGYTGKSTCVTKLYYAKMASQNPHGMSVSTACYCRIVHNATLPCQCNIGHLSLLNLEDNIILFKSRRVAV